MESSCFTSRVYRWPLCALALVGWSVFRTQVGEPGTLAVLSWLTFAVNAWMVTLTLVLSPALGVGDWHLTLRDLPNAGLLRVSATITGLYLAGILLKGTRRTLAQLTGNGRRDARVRRARSVIVTAWRAGGPSSRMLA